MEIKIQDGYLVDVNAEGVRGNTFCTAVDLVEKHCNLLTSDVTVALKIWQGESEQTFRVSRETLTPKSLYSFLLKKGASIADDDLAPKAVSSYLFSLDADLPFNYYHESLGFVEIEGQLVFLHNHPIGKLGGAKAGSSYVNPAEISSQGSLADWKQVMTKEVCKHTPLEIALAVGFSAPVAHLLRQENVFSEVPIIAYIGESSTGKTTAAKLGASIYGSITEGAGIVKDINATKTAFFKILEQQRGFPQILDESTGTRDWNLADTIYELSKGTAKATCTSQSELKARTKFSGSIIITGEKSIFGTGNTQLGMLARVCELTLPWTKNADHSRRLCAKLSASHGTAVVPFIEYLLQEYAQDSSFLAKLHNDEIEQFRTLLPNIDGVEERLLNIYATILVSAKLANDALGLALDLEAMRKLLAEHHNKKKPVKSQARLLYELVVSKINLYHTHFPSKEQLTTFGAPNCKIMGMQEKEGNKVIVWITCETFCSFVKQQFPNYTSLLGHMFKEGLIKRDAHRHYKTQKTLNLGKVPCYCLILDGCLHQSMEFVGDKPQPPKTGKSLLEENDEETTKVKNSTSPQMAYLLADADDEPDAVAS